MSLILHIETATKQCSVSLGKNGQLIACKELAEEGFNHAEKLHVFIEELIAETGNKIKDLKAVSVSKGPGSYTGLRIGVSTAKGLCYSLGIPLISVNTLEILARKIQIEDGIIIPMIDARRMEVFTAHFDNEYNLIKETYALVLNEESFNDVEGKVYFVGDGALKAKELYTKDRFVFNDEVVYPSSRQMIDKSYQKFLNNEFEDVAYFEPFYLKEFMLTTKK